MRQNIYDDPEFFAGYQAMRERRTGAHESIVLPLLGRLLPPLEGARVVDVGCGDGWLAREAVARGAAQVTALDPSRRMLDLAAERTEDSRITYRQAFLEDAELPEGRADCVVSVFALHYVDDLAGAVRRQAGWLAPGGVLVAVLEHPIYLAASPERDFERRPGRPPRWLLQGYDDEGPRVEHWFADGVVKYHRRMSSIVNVVIDAGLRLERVEEPAPDVPADQETIEEARARPVVLGLRARLE